MTDDKKSPDGFDDWDQALSDWDNKTFFPEVAKDTATDKPGALAGSAPSRPLYRPPVSKPSPARVSQAPRPKPSGPVPPLPRIGRPEDDGDSATLIAAAPRELTRSPTSPSCPRPRRAAVWGSSLLARRSANPRCRSPVRRIPNARSRSNAAEARTEPSDGAAKANAAASCRGAPSLPTPEVAPAAPPTSLLPGDPWLTARDRCNPRSPRPTRSTLSSRTRCDLRRWRPSSRGRPWTRKRRADRLPSLVAPEARSYDPDEDTMTSTNEDLARLDRMLAERRVEPVRRRTDERADHASLGPWSNRSHALGRRSVRRMLGCRRAREQHSPRARHGWSRRHAPSWTRLRAHGLSSRAAKSWQPSGTASEHGPSQWRLET